MTAEQKLIISLDKFAVRCEIVLILGYEYRATINGTKYAQCQTFDGAVESLLFHFNRTYHSEMKA